MLNLSLVEILILVPTILIALTIHELSHAIVALWLGDDTAKVAGRITLNPLKHVDPAGFVMLIVIGFGWAKPVRFSREKLKNPNRDEILIAFAGPLSNLLLAFIGIVILRLVLSIDVFSKPDSIRLIWNILSTFIAINIALAVFNSIPIPPLDGSHIFARFFSNRKNRTAALFRQYSPILLIGIILLERITGYDILPIGKAIDGIFTFMLRIVGLA